MTAIADDTIELEIAPGLRTTWVRAAVREVIVPGPSEDLDLAIDAEDPDVIDANDSAVIDADERSITDKSVTDRQYKNLN